MKISKHWLQQFIDIKNIQPQEIAKRLTLSTVEVEGVGTLGEGLDGVVVGLITNVSKHPNADKLNVCVVDIGKKELNIVCGGSNVREGMKVALASIGAKVRWHGQGDLVELKPVEIRGVASDGMICASDEIGLLELFPTTAVGGVPPATACERGPAVAVTGGKKEEKEILDLTHLPAKPGTLLSEALGLDDVIFEIDNKSLSNRPDLWGHYGIAREVGALFKKMVKPYKTHDMKALKHKNIKTIDLTVDVQDKKLCPRYMAIVIDGITVQPSPEWLQTRLRAVGLRPINNIVDITNYVMLEVGQPMHAFDAEHLNQKSKIKNQKSNHILIRKAQKGEIIHALDGKEYTLSPEMVVIADDEQAIAIAGVIGGEGSGVTGETTTIIFESAHFDAASIRKTSTALGLRTDASTRFEKSLSPERPEIALRRAVELTLTLCPGARIASRVIDKKVPLKKPQVILLANSFVFEKVGIKIALAEQAAILQRLGFEVKKQTSGLRVTIPLWRAKDITIPEDLVEEIVRVYGYEKIPATLPAFPIVPPAPNPLRLLERRLRELLAYEHGFTEVYNYSFVAPEWVEKVGLKSNEHLALHNPIAKDRPLLRRSLKPGLLENVESNLHRFSRVTLFEIGRTYLGETIVDGLPLQPTMAGIVCSDHAIAVPFRVLSTTLQEIFARFGIVLMYEKSDSVGPVYHPGRSAYLVVDGQKIGSIGEIHPQVAKRLGIGERVAIAEFSLDTLLRFVKEQTSYQPIPAYPAVTRDIAFVVDKKVSHDALQSRLQSAHQLVAKVELFDVYEGDKLPAGKKSMAYHIIYTSQEKTLEAKAVDAIHARIVIMLKDEFGAEIRI